MTIDRSDELREWYAEDEPPDPVPLTTSVDVPPFPVDALPGPVADMVTGVAEATQTDPAMAGTSALATMSACTGGRAVIEIRPGWREPLNTYTAPIASPGERKSAVQQAMTRAIREAERQLEEKAEAEIAEAEARKQIAGRAAEHARARAAKAAGGAQKDADAAMADAIGADAIYRSITIPARPRIIADDVTPEACVSLLAEQGGRLAVFSAEGGIFDIIAGRYSGAVPNMDVWLKAHAGDPVRVDRKGRESERIDSPALTLGLMIQPSVLATIAHIPGFRGRGLLARFLFAPTERMAGKRKIAATPVADEVRSAYDTTITDLALGMAAHAGDPAVLTLTDTAQKAFQVIEERIEASLAEGAEMGFMADWGSKLPGAVARIAGNLHLAEYGAEDGVSCPVDANTVKWAWRIGEFFKAAAINAFTEMGTDPVTGDAVYLWGRIKSLGVSELSERDMHFACRGKFKTKNDMVPALERLIDHGHLTPLSAPERDGAGRPASPRYRVWGV